jgi:hypothetical protein
VPRPACRLRPRLNNTEKAAAQNFNDAEQSRRDNGYEGAFTGFTWDSDTGGAEDADAEDVAAANGCKLGQFLLDFRCECPDGDLHLISHSLGAVVVKHTLKWLKQNGQFDGKGSGIVESVHLLGAALSETMPGECASLIECTVGEFHNYWNWDDDILSATYPWGEALGETGAQGDEPENYTDHDVADEVGSDHSGYNGEDEDPNDDGVIDRVKEHMDAARIAKAPTGDGDGPRSPPSDDTVDSLVSQYHSTSDRYRVVNRLFGDEHVNLYVVGPQPPGPAQGFDVTQESAIAEYAFRFEDAEITGWTEGAAPSRTMDVHATKPAIEWIARSARPVTALRTARQQGTVAIDSHDHWKRTTTGCSTYAVDTQQAVVRTWDRTISAVRSVTGF